MDLVDGRNCIVDLVITGGVVYQPGNVSTMGRLLYNQIAKMTIIILGGAH